MFAQRTEGEFVFIDNENGERVGIFSTRSKAHMEALLVIVGKQVFDILQFTIGKKVNMRTLEILEYNETDPIGTPRKSFKESRR